MELICFLLLQTVLFVCDLFLVFANPASFVVESRGEMMNKQ